jgi:hypothetical protein
MFRGSRNSSRRISPGLVGFLFIRSTPTCPLVVVNDIHIYRPKVGPAKNNSPLVVHSDAVKSAPTALEGFKTIPGWRSEISQFVPVVEHVQFASDDPGHALPTEPSARLTSLEERADCRIRETPNGHF